MCRGEAALLARVGRGDKAAFEGVYDLYGRAVYSVALNMLGDRLAAEDIAQEVFLAVWRGAAAYDPSRGSVRSWILAQAHHKSVDALRRQRLRVAAPLDERMTHDSDIVEDTLQRLAGEGIRAALRLLSPPQREAIVLAYYRGYTQQEIATRLGVPLGTIKTRTRDGLLRLRQVLPQGV